ncbi:MAG: peptidoglycan-binding protein, partial [Salinibacter sp.]
GAPRAWGTGGTPSGGGLVITAVHLQYWTAWVEADGSAHFRKDAYQRDEPLYEAVTAAPSAE